MGAEGGGGWGGRGEIPSMARSGSSNDFFLVRIDLWVLWLATLEGVAGTDLETLPPFAGFALEDVLPIVDNNVKTFRQSPHVPHFGRLRLQIGTNGFGRRNHMADISLAPKYNVRGCREWASVVLK